MKNFSIVLTSLVLMGLVGSCTNKTEEPGDRDTPFFWKNANVYFLLTDRFFNGDPSNDINFSRVDETALLRGFEGGDIKGVISKIEEGYFEKLGITALWISPFFEQIHGSTNEGTGVTYGYHGYWTKDWTSLDPNFGTEEDLQLLVETAHAFGIRIVMDVIINHTGPVTGIDPVWPEQWVRTSPSCEYTSYETTVSCTLVENLPDIRTEQNEDVELPPELLEKWAREGRLEQELSELEDFFQSTSYPRAPRYYLIKWLTDFVKKYGIDAYRLDTAKHIEESVWAELWKEAQKAFQEWKEQNPGKVLDSNDFFMVGEVYNYGIRGGRKFNFGDREVDFFAESIHSLINFDFKSSASDSYEALFSSYSDLLQKELKGQGVWNYITSHDDGDPFDKERKRALEAGTKLLLSPGTSQVYYGDESSRVLVIPGAIGDATLRGLMNWDEIESNTIRSGIPVASVLSHYQKLGQFRRDHPSVGAGIHLMISQEPYVFSRNFVSGAYTDKVVVGLDLEPGKKTIEVSSVFENGTSLFEYYSGSYVSVRNGMAQLNSEASTVLLGEK